MMTLNDTDHISMFTVCSSSTPVRMFVFDIGTDGGGLGDARGVRLVDYHRLRRTYVRILGRGYASTYVRSHFTKGIGYRSAGNRWLYGVT